MRRLLLLASLVASPLGAWAAWTGNPAHALEGGAVSMGYQGSTRDVELTGGTGSTIKFKTRGLVFEQRSAVNPVVQVALRLLPLTGRMNMESSSFNPHVGGAGVGVYLAPPEPLGAVRLGAAAVWDGAGGARKRPNSNPKRYDRVYWSETTLAAGAAVSPVEAVSVYGGLSYVSFRARFSVGGSKTNWKQDSPWGGFGGVTFSSNQAWLATAELRVGGEKSMSVSLGYKY